MPGDLRRILELQKARAPEIGRAPLGERKRKLRRIHDEILRRREEIHRALATDLGKSDVETDLSEIFAPLAEARHALRHLKRWSRTKVATPLVFFGTRSEIRYQPKGVVLIIAPWNFPFNLTMGPLVSAVAAGNCVVLKPSELAPATAACVRSVIESIFDESEVAVVEGDAAVGEALVRLPFDHIFFTGSSRVGALVARAAAENLVPVTLELGGKSPAIVDETANIAAAATRIAWGKFLNNGQTCVAPDYVLVQESVAAEFKTRLLQAMREIWGPADALPENSDYGRIIGQAHHQRLQRFAASAAGEARVLWEGRHDQRTRYFAPMIVENVEDQSPLRREEIFGPILPVNTFSTLDDAIAQVNSLGHPLAFYIFSRDRANLERVISGTRAGGTLINDTLVHFFQLDLPFGGAGRSGLGKAHGQAGFQAFSNARGVMRPLTGWSTIQLLYPPYNSFKRKLVELTIRYL